MAIPAAMVVAYMYINICMCCPVHMCERVFEEGRERNRKTEWEGGLEGTSRSGVVSSQVPVADVSHDETPALEFLPIKPRLGLLSLQLERDGASFFHVEQLLEELPDVVVRLGRCLEEAARPALGFLLARGGLYLPGVRLVALVAHQHDGDALGVVSLHLSYHLEDGPELFQALPGGDGVDENEGVSSGDVQSLHGRELVTARRVGDLQRADVLVAADHLPVGVFDGGDVALPKGPLDEPQHQGALADAAGAKHHHPVVVALLGHLLQKRLKR